MARNPRREIEGKYFHIMVQGIGKEYVFPTDEFKGYYLSVVVKYKDKYKIKLLAFCIMGNHAHLLLKTNGNKDLSLLMSNVNTDYAGYYNRIKKRMGYVFRGRYKSEVIKDVGQLIYCLSYIQNNPVKAKVVQNAKDYKYSSYINYLTREGAVDFKEAARHYDTAPENITAIMKERTDLSWMEHDDKDYEDGKGVFEELLKRNKIGNKKDLLCNKELLKEIILEIKNRSGLSLRKISDLLCINREYVRCLVSTRPSP